MKFQDGAYLDSGPRPTPTIRNGRVFVHNTDGYLVCLDAKTGTKLWSRHAKGEFKSSATWHGCVASPLVTDNAVILPVGATNAGVVAFAVDSGKTLWQVSDDKASGASPFLANIGGRQQLVVVTRSALRSLDPESGHEFWSLNTPRQTSGNLYAATPILVDSNTVFLTGWYKLGAQLIRVIENKPQVLWHNDKSLSSHYAAPIIRDGYAYGFHGHAWENSGPALRCIELATGKMMWEQPKFGSGTIVKCGDQLLVLTDTGELLLAKADPKEFKVISRA